MVLKKWLLILIVGILGGALGPLYAFCRFSTYTEALRLASSNSSSVAE